MRNTFLSRIGGAVLALALGTTTLAAVGAATPAGAATSESCTSKATLKLTPGYAGYRPAPYYGQSLYLDGDVTYVCPSDPGYAYHVNAGTVWLDINTGTGWRHLKSFTDGYPYLSTTYVGRASYRLTYSGGTNSYGETLSAVPTSNVVSTGTVYRSAAGSTARNRGSYALFKIRVSPAFSGKVLLQRKYGKKWKKVRKVRMRSGLAKLRISYPSHGKITYRVVVPAAGGFPALPIVFWVKRS